MEYFDEIHKVVLDGISDHIESLSQTGKHGDINEEDPTIMVYYIVKYVSDALAL